MNTTSQLTYRVGRPEGGVLVKLTDDSDVTSDSVDVEPPVNVRGSGRVQIKMVLNVAGITLASNISYS